MAGRAVLAVVVYPLRDAQWSEGGGVERDGAVEIRHGDEDVVEHDSPLLEDIVCGNLGWV